MTYIESQFEEIEGMSDDYPTRMKLRSDSGETNWLNVSPEQLQRIKEILSEES